MRSEGRRCVPVPAPGTVRDEWAPVLPCPPSLFSLSPSARRLNVCRATPRPGYRHSAGPSHAHWLNGRSGVSPDRQTGCFGVPSLWVPRHCIQPWSRSLTKPSASETPERNWPTSPKPPPPSRTRQPTAQGVHLVPRANGVAVAKQSLGVRELEGEKVADNYSALAPPGGETHAELDCWCLRRWRSAVLGLSITNNARSASGIQVRLRE